MGGRGGKAGGGGGGGGAALDSARDEMNRLATETLNADKAAVTAERALRSAQDSGESAGRINDLRNNLANRRDDHARSSAEHARQVQAVQNIATKQSGPAKLRPEAKARMAKRLSEVKAREAKVQKKFQARVDKARADDKAMAKRSVKSLRDEVHRNHKIFDSRGMTKRDLRNQLLTDNHSRKVLGEAFES